MRRLSRKEFLMLAALLPLPRAAQAALPPKKAALPHVGLDMQDNTASAAVEVQHWEAVPAAVPPRAFLFPLSSVRLLDGPFKDAQETDRAYLLTLDPDRLLAWMRQNVGLAPKAPHYGGWDGGGAGMIGHYLSAISQMAVATGDSELHRRVGYIASEMAACQKAGGDGGLYSFGWDKNTYFTSLAAGKVIPVNTSAWYVTHKTMAGLRDAYLLCGDATARDTLVRMCDWADSVTSALTPAQWQEMLGPPDKMGEFGGPHEVLADVYAFTGDQKYLTLAEKFRHDLVFDPMLRADKTFLDNRHANTEIPKFVGYERIYELTGAPQWHQAAQNFWEDVAQNRTWANGGNGQWEHFFPADQTPSKVVQTCGPETCATYNILKLTLLLHSRAPSSRYADFYERSLYNSILPSQAPGSGFVYYTSMRPGHYRRFSRPFDAFWCCVGTGMENHGKYGEFVYAHAGDALYVNLFVPSVLNWQERGLTLRQETTFPAEPRARLTLTLARPQRLTLKIRRPAWLAGEMTARVNGRPIPMQADTDGYVALPRTWRSGDTVEFGLPMQVTADLLPHGTNFAAFSYGPALLAGTFAARDLTRADFYGGGDNTDINNQLANVPLETDEFPALHAASPAELAARVAPVKDTPLTFQMTGLTEGGAITLTPFYATDFQRYTVYWPLQTRDDLAQARKEAAVTIDRVRIGEADSEAAHGLQADQSHTGASGDPYSHWRDATGSFGYTVNVLSGQPVALQCAYWGSDAGRTFDVQVDGTTIATQMLTGAKPNAYLTVVYPIPPALTQGKDHVFVRFVPRPHNTAGGLFDLRVIRAP